MEKIQERVLRFIYNDFQSSKEALLSLADTILEVVFASHDCDPIEWWKKNETKYSNISIIAF